MSKLSNIFFAACILSGVTGCSKQEPGQSVDPATSNRVVPAAPQIQQSPSATVEQPALPSSPPQALAEMEDATLNCSRATKYAYDLARSSETAIGYETEDIKTAATYFALAASAKYGQQAVMDDYAAREPSLLEFSASHLADCMQLFGRSLGEAMRKQTTPPPLFPENR